MRLQGSILVVLGKRPAAGSRRGQSPFPHFMTKFEPAHRPSLSGVLPSPQIRIPPPTLSGPGTLPGLLASNRRPRPTPHLACLPHCIQQSHLKEGTCGAHLRRAGPIPLHCSILLRRQVWRRVAHLLKSCRVPPHPFRSPCGWRKRCQENPAWSY